MSASCWKISTWFSNQQRVVLWKLIKLPSFSIFYVSFISCRHFFFRWALRFQQRFVSESEKFTYFLLFVHSSVSLSAACHMHIRQLSLIIHDEQLRQAERDNLMTFLKSPQWSLPSRNLRRERARAQTYLCKQFFCSSRENKTSNSDIVAI